MAKKSLQDPAKPRAGATLPTPPECPGKCDGAGLAMSFCLCLTWSRLVLSSLVLPIIFFGFYPEPLLSTTEISIENVIEMYNNNINSNLVDN